MKKIICKIFGHALIEEVYAVRVGEKHFRVVKEIKCLRCGKTTSSQMTEPKRRSVLLQEGWFLEN